MLTANEVKRSTFLESEPPEASGQLTPTLRVDDHSDELLASPWSFDSLMRPVTAATFFSEYWGKRPLHIARARTDFYAGLITLAELERYLSMQDIFSRHFITTPRKGYGVPDPPPASISELYDRLLDGSSLRVRQMECFMDPSAPVISLLRGMELSLQHPRNSLSCYVAPQNAVGLGPHHDENDVFTLQISGMKRWRLYHRAESDCPEIYAQDVLGRPVDDVMLKAGDLLYLPRGWVHDVTSEVPAFSLTIVFDPIKWRAVLSALMEKLAATPEFMAPMPAGVLLGPSRPDLLHREFETRVALIRDALAALTVDDVVDDVAPMLVGRMTLPPDAQLNAIFGLDRMTLETIVNRRPGVACHLRRRDDKIAVILPGGYMLQASVRVEPALLCILNSDGPFRVAEMHESLGGPAKLALAKKLVSCGLLRVV